MTLRVLRSPEDKSKHFPVVDDFNFESTEIRGQEAQGLPRFLDLLSETKGMQRCVPSRLLIVFFLESYHPDFETSYLLNQ